MKQFLWLIFVIIIPNGAALSQQTPTLTPTPTRPAAPPQQRQGPSFEVAEYGVEFQADPRLIVMMAALEAAGFNPIPTGRQPSAFRAMVRKDLADLDPDLRN